MIVINTGDRIWSVLLVLVKVFMLKYSYACTLDSPPDCEKFAVVSSVHS